MDCWQRTYTTGGPITQEESRRRSDGATEHVITSAANLDFYHTTSTNDRVQIADGKFLLIAGYRRLHLGVD